MGVAMHQSGPRPVAPPDLDPRWPAGYMAVLREAGAHEKAIPYCIGWVRQFFAAYPGRERRELGRTEYRSACLIPPSPTLPRKGGGGKV
jgi:hypothetical protein